MNWIMPANPNSLDHAGAFKEWGFIDWKQSVEFAIGDIVYLYCTSPQQKYDIKLGLKKLICLFLNVKIIKNIGGKKNSMNKI